MDELLKLPVENKNEIKKLENIKQKILNAKWSKIFNEICIILLYKKLYQKTLLSLKVCYYRIIKYKFLL